MGGILAERKKSILVDDVAEIINEKHQLKFGEGLLVHANSLRCLMQMNKSK